VDQVTGATPNFAYGFGKADAQMLLTSKNINVHVDSIVGICIGGTATLAVTSPNTLYGVLWSNGSTGLTTTTAIVGTYSVRVLDSAGCYTRSNPVTLGYLTPPFVDAGASFTSCPGVPITLLGTGNAVSYQWQNGILNNHPFIPLTAATYHVTGTGANGCQASDSVTVNLYNQLTVVYDELITTVMQGSGPFNVTLGSPAGGTYSGTGIIGTSFHPTLSGPGSFTITYSVTDVHGCVFSDSSIIEVVDPNGIDALGWNWGLYPNPTDGTLHLQGISEPADLEIYDATGRSVLHVSQYQPESALPLTMAPGVYHLAAKGRVVRFILH